VKAAHAGRKARQFLGDPDAHRLPLLAEGADPQQQGLALRAVHVQQPALPHGQRGQRQIRVPQGTRVQPHAAGFHQEIVSGEGLLVDALNAPFVERGPTLPVEAQAAEQVLAVVGEAAGHLFLQQPMDRDVHDHPQAGEQGHQAEQQAQTQPRAQGIADHGNSPNT